MTQITILPGDNPLILGRCNYDTLSPKRHSDVSVIEQGVSDEAIVDVKRVACDGAVTYLRVILLASDRRLESKGGTH